MVSTASTCGGHPFALLREGMQFRRQTSIEPDSAQIILLIQDYDSEAAQA